MQGDVKSSKSISSRCLSHEFHSYGITANCNTFPVAFTILLGNEDKNGWIQFWNYAKSLHPSHNKEGVTIITDLVIQ